jgi:hypothetical protein
MDMVRITGLSTKATDSIENLQVTSKFVAKNKSNTMHSYVEVSK